jgi:hypothetical protein
MHIHYIEIRVYTLQTLFCNTFLGKSNTFLGTLFWDIKVSPQMCCPKKCYRLCKHFLGTLQEEEVWRERDRVWSGEKRERGRREAWGPSNILVHSRHLNVVTTCIYPVSVYHILEYWSVLEYSSIFISSTHQALECSHEYIPDTCIF